MDDRTYGPSDGHMRFGEFGARRTGAGDDGGGSVPERAPEAEAEAEAGARPRPAPDSDFDFAAFERSFSGGEASTHSLPLIVAGGVLVAMIVLSVVYSWPIWATVLCIVALVAVAGAGMLRRPPVAPLELTSSERDRVRRVLDEHGLRPAVALVRALYPGESSVAAAKTVAQLLERR